MRRPPATIVILAWNEWAATRACLDSLRPTLGVHDQVVVVDNGSVDQTPRALKRYPWAEVVTNEQNRGFAAGCNQGAAAARHDLVVFLNNDTLLVGRWLDALLEPFADATVGATGARSNFVSGDQLVEVDYHTARLPEIRRFERAWRQRHAGQVSDAARLVGFCLAVRREVFEAVGAFDEGFGIGGFEDDDLCTRLLGAGRRLVIAHGSFVHHDGHKTFDANGIDWLALQQENEERYRAKHRAVSATSEGVGTAARESQDDVGAALATRVEPQTVRDSDSHAMPEEVEPLRRGMLCFDAEQWDEALEHFVDAATISPGSTPWALLATVCANAGADGARVAELVEREDLITVTGQLLAVPAAAADAVVEALWERFSQDTRLLAWAVQSASSLEVERALEWSARLRAAGIASQCPLLAIARDWRRQLPDRLRAIALISGAFDADQGGELLAELAWSVQEPAFLDSLLVLDSLAPELLPRFVELLATTAPRCRSLSTALEQLGAPEEAVIVASMGEALPAVRGADVEPTPGTGSQARASGLPPGVFVLGMHRSGTSAVTRVLNLLGPGCADESDLMPAKDTENPRGFWESTSLAAVNDALLEHLGGSWSAPPAPTTGWAQALAAFVPAARATFERSHGNAGGWVWKDPRTCLTFPFWCDALPVVPVIVLPYRNPLEVWRSLERRNGLSKDHALALWERYTRSALRAASGRPALVTSYGELLSAPEAWSERAASFLSDHGLTVDVDSARPAITSFLEDTLRHTTFSTADLDEDEDVTPAQRALWARLEELRGAHQCFEPGALPAESSWVEGLLEARRNPAARPRATGSGDLSSSALRATGSRAVPRCSIIIPLFNKVEYTERCLEALITGTDDELYELVLVDNASTDDTESLLRRLEGDVVIIRNEVNLGFAGASNQGARAARGEHLLFLNNDTEAHPGWLSPLLDALDADPETLAVGPRLLFPDGRVQHAGVLVAEDHRPGHIPLTPFHRLYCEPADHPDVMRREHMSALTGAALLVRRPAFFDAGGFDEAFWNGYEDVDLCFKLRERGGNLIYEPASCLVHHESVSGPERFAKVDRNVALLVDRWAGRVPADVVIDEDGLRELREGMALAPIGPPNGGARRTPLGIAVSARS